MFKKCIHYLLFTVSQLSINNDLKQMTVAIVFFCFGGRVSSGPSWPQTCLVGEDDLEPLILWVLGL